MHATVLKQTLSQIITFFLDPILQWRKQLPFPQCLWDRWREWKRWTWRRPPAELVTARPWQRCSSYVMAGRSPEPLCRASAFSCPRQSLRWTLATMLMSLQCSSKCQQRATVTVALFNYVCFADSLFAFMASDLSFFFFVCGRHENKKVEFFTRGLQETQWVTTLALFSRSTNVPVTFAILSYRAVFHTQWISSVG